MTGGREIVLSQLGRASLEFLGALGARASALQRQMAVDYSASITSLEVPATDATREVKVAFVEGVMARVPAYRYWSVLSRWGSEQNTLVASAAFDEARAAIEPSLTIDPSAIEEPSDFEAPSYWKDFEFHLTAGGWDGHEHMGFIHHELVYEYVVAPGFAGKGGGDITAQRAHACRELPRTDYERVLELGCATGRFTEALAQVFPNAAITGIDPSIAELRYCARWAHDHGRTWSLRRAVAERTGFGPDSFDLVAAYIVLHEMPPNAVVDALRESFRVLAPGGQFLAADVTPYAQLDAYRTFVNEWEPRYRNEPWWRTTAQLDLAGLLTEVGFVDVRAYGLGPAAYPWIVMGTKP